MSTGRTRKKAGENIFCVNIAIAKSCFGSLGHHRGAACCALNLGRVGRGNAAPLQKEKPAPPLAKCRRGLSGPGGDAPGPEALKTSSLMT